MHAGDSRPVCSHRCGELVARTGVPLADVYLEFLGGRSRPNTVRAAAYDLKVFFAAVAVPPDQVRPADVLAFITAQRTGRSGEHGALQPVRAQGEPGGVSAATVRRRLSIVSGVLRVLAGPRGCGRQSGVAGAADPAGAVPPGPACPAGARHPEAAANPGPGRGGCADGDAGHAP